ncbi:S66 peptidase family protein [uncultured Leifsonia sp.]|uniref:S66 family peptidase n=1 Tax=uncultured Leifsonia sp. TaxID=340359 RepID=UPI0025FD8F30|nr:S66 peptidase family protein [uncultured Leifsonia sp.]
MSCPHRPVLPPVAHAGDRVAVVSPSFAAPGRWPTVHEQALRRIHELTGLIPVEYPTTRQLGASPQERARDLNAAFADPDIRAVVATIGGDDQLRVIPHLDRGAVLADPKPFLGYSDNTNLLNWLWSTGVGGFYGGSTQVQLGPGPQVHDIHARSLRAALLGGGRIELTDPGESEDVGVDWGDPRALTETGEREPTDGFGWAGPERTVSGPTWGGCLEVVDWILLADRFPFAPAALEGAVLLLETSELTPPAHWVRYTLRALGERGLLAPLAGVLAARPPASTLEHTPGAREREAFRTAQRDAVIDTVAEYNPDAVVCVGVPFGHTSPQWIVPYGGSVTLDGVRRRVFADYSRA